MKSIPYFKHLRARFCRRTTRLSFLGFQSPNRSALGPRPIGLCGASIIIGTDTRRRSCRYIWNAIKILIREGWFGKYVVTPKSTKFALIVGARDEVLEALGNEGALPLRMTTTATHTIIVCLRRKLRHSFHPPWN